MTLEERAAAVVQALRDFYTSDETHWEIKHPIADEAADLIEELLAKSQPTPDAQPS